MSVERATRAGAWSALDILLRQGVQFVVSVILARLLAPADFGLIAILTFFTSLSVVFVQGGLSLALVQKQDTTREEESAVFWVNLIASTSFAVVFCLIGPAAARFYGQPLLRELMFVAAAQVIIAALGAVHTELLTRSLRFDQLTKVGISSSLLSAVAGVAGAAAGLGVWALASQLVVQALAMTLALWWVSSWRPQWRFRLRAIRELYGFGVFISLSSVLEVLYANGFSLLLGKAYGMADLGLFNRALTTQALPGNVVSSILSRVALPIFSARAGDPDGIKRALRMALSLGMMFSAPIVAGIAVLSDLVLRCLFGPQWVPAAHILTILALAGSILPLHVLNLQALLALGCSNQWFTIELKKKLVGIVLVLFGSFFGIDGLAYALLVGSVFSLWFNSAPMKDLIGYGIFEQLTDLRDVVLVTAVMVLVVSWADSALTAQPWTKLVSLTIVGALVYFGIGFAFRLRNFTEAFELSALLLPQSRGTRPT